MARPGEAGPGQVRLGSFNYGIRYGRRARQNLASDTTCAEARAARTGSGEYMPIRRPARASSGESESLRHRAEAPGKDPMIEFIIPGVPIAQPRQRVGVVAGHARTYTPSTHPVVTFKATAKLTAAAAYRGSLLSGPVEVILIFVFPRPKNAPKFKPGRTWRCKKPDVDNCAKSVLDSLNGVLWEDDRQVVALSIYKHEASIAEVPHVEVTICDLT